MYNDEIIIYKKRIFNLNPINNISVEILNVIFDIDLNYLKFISVINDCFIDNGNNLNNSSMSIINDSVFEDFIKNFYNDYDSMNIETKLSIKAEMRIFLIRFFDNFFDYITKLLNEFYNSFFKNKYLNNDNTFLSEEKKLEYINNDINSQPCEIFFENNKNIINNWENEFFLSNINPYKNQLLLNIFFSHYFNCPAFFNYNEKIFIKYYMEGLSYEKMAILLNFDNNIDEESIKSLKLQNKIIFKDPFN